MRELILNGYIDDDVWYGDEITPETLHESLYGANNENTDNVHIRLNSYGGSCNAAVRMYDDIRAYPGTVSITVSGTAASAATMLCMAADHLEITPGSLFMIHDPSMMAFGNEHDLNESIQVLRACKESILNMYERRVRAARIDVAAMMTACTWFDANSALQYGFVDSIANDPVKYPVNAAEDRSASTEKAIAALNTWMDRKRTPRPPAAAVPAAPAAPISHVSETDPGPAAKPEPGPAHEPRTEPEPDATSEPTFEPTFIPTSDSDTENTVTPESAAVPESTAADFSVAPEPDVSGPIVSGPVSHPDRVKVTATDMRLEDLKY